MSWEEYKKKQDNKNNKGIVQENYQSQNSWEEYKYKTKQSEMQKAELQRLEEEKRKQQSKQSQQLKQQASKINSISKNNNQGLNNSKFQALENKELKYETNLPQIKAYTATDLAKDLNISVEDAQKRMIAQNQESEKDVFTKLSNNIRNSAVGNSPGGKFVAGALDTYNALGDGDLLNIVQNVESGITTGFANTISYLENVNKKKNEILDNMGVGGKILAGLTGDFAYVFSDEERREKGYDTINNWATNLKKQENEKVQKNIESTNSKVTKKVAELSPSMGNNLVGAGISAVNPVAGTAYFVTSAAGSYYDDAINRGMNEDQALLYGGVMGAMEGLTEEIPIGKMLGAGKNIGKATIKETLKEYGISMAENAIQEAVIEPISEISAYAIGGKETADFSNMTSRMLKSGVDGALSAVLLSGVNAGVNSAVKLQNKIANKQQITSKELQQCMQEIQESGKVDVEKIFKQEMQYQAQKTKSTYYDYNTGKKLDTDSQNILNQAEDIIKQNNVPNIEKNIASNQDNTQNLQQNIAKNQNNTEQRQTSRQDSKSSLNSNVESQNNYITSAQKYNIDTNNQSVRKIGELASKRGINITYNDTLFKNNPNANAIYQTKTDEKGNVTRNIILNPNANTNRTLEQIELHEIVHDMYGTEEFNKIKEMVLEYDKSKAGYQEARAGLEELYSQVYDKNSSDFQNLVDEEAVADILGNKLGDQQFVNELVNMKESRSVARKIYDWIVEKLNNMTRRFENMNSYFYWKDVKNKFEEAFRQEYQGNSNSTRYSVMYNDDGTFNRVKIEDDIFKNNNGKSISQTMMNYLKEHIGDYAEIIESGQKVYLGEDLPGEYSHSKSAENLPTKDKLAKGRAVTGLQEIIENAQNRRWEPNKKKKHSVDAKYGFYRYDTNFSFEHNGKEQIYSATILIRNDANGKKYLYDILNPKKIGSNLLPVASNSSKSSAIVGSSNSLPINSIAQNDEKINSDTTTQYSMQESENNSGSFNLHKNHKQHQLEIIKKYNPMNDDYHTGIRSINDIKTLEETIQDSDWAEYDEFNPDLTKKDINKAIETGKITVYSSYPIEQGTFISPSRMEAESYSENGKVYSKEVNIEDIAWIDPTQGQYAKVDDTKYSTQSNNAWQEHLDKNYKNNNKGTRLQDVKLPVKETITKKMNLPKKDNVNVENDITGEQKLPLNEEAKQEKVAKILTEPIEKVKEKDRTWAIFEANVFDKGIVFEKLSRKADKVDGKAGSNRDLQGKWDFMLVSQARGQNAIGEARYEYDSKTKTRTQICKSLEDIKTEVGNNRAEFYDYMYHQLNIDRMTLEDRYGTANKPVFGKSVTAEISQKIVAEYETKNPKFKEWAQDVYDYNNANKQELVKNGVISQETADHFAEMYPHYVPIKRVDKRGNAIKVPLETNRTGINSPIAKAKGGNGDIQSMFETMADRTLQTYRASARNSFGVELKNTLNKLNQLQQNENVDVNVDDIVETMGEQTNSDELLQKGKNGMNPTFTVFENGKKVTFDVSKDMYDALKPLSDSSLLSKTIKPLNKFNNFRRAVLTEYNPVFLITNAKKDVQDVIGNSQHATKTYLKFPEAYYQILSKGYWYNEYVANGGKTNSYFNDGKFESDKKVPKAKNIIKKVVTFPFNAISSANNVIEMAPRLAEYIASRESGASIQTSMLDASRVTTNFKAGGDLTKFANRNGVTFLNASVQGMMQQVRNIQEANAKGIKGWTVLACKYTLLGVPTLILNHLLWGDDDDYEELPDYVKDNYYCIAKFGDGRFIRIPKGRLAATVGKVVSNVDKYITGDKELNADNLVKDFWEDLLFAGDNLAPNNPIDNNVISPVVQAVTNRSWYGEDIVPSRLQDKPVKEQYDETTDSLSIWLGDKLNVSPYKINYVLDQYSGGAGDVVLPMMTKQAENNVIEDKFTTDSTMKSKYPGEFYSKIDELKVNSNSSQATDEDILKYKYASSVSEEMGKLYKKKREIQNSDETDEEKKKQLKEVQKQINELAKNGLKDIEDFKIKNNSTVIGNNQYYKTINLTTEEEQWEKLSEKEIEKNKNIKLENYADYKKKVAKETISQRKSGEIEKNKDISDKSKMKILINSKYDNSEKASIYENYIGTQDELYSVVMKNSGININEYLKYKTQEFTSDKKDDGTVDGKSISGSKKKKVYEYVNNMKITGNQRLLLLGTQYKLSNSERTALAQYVKSLNITNKEKLEIYKKLQGFKVYKDGRVTW